MEEFDWASERQNAWFQKQWKMVVMFSKIQQKRSRAFAESVIKILMEIIKRRVWELADQVDISSMEIALKTKILRLVLLKSPL
jgi:hypothetical protein